MNPKVQSEKRSHILYDAARVDHVDERFFEPAFWRAGGGVTGAPAGRGTTLFVQHGGLQLALRHYLRGGLAARLTRDRYLWTGLAKTRPWREWQLLAELHQAGLPVPAPVAARVVREGLFWRGDLVTERLAARPLSALAVEAPLPPEQWQAVGACIARFHTAGVFHADLNAHNLLIDEAGAVFLIDFDRGERRSPGAWQSANLARLRRSLEKLRAGSGLHFGEAEWAEVLRGYGKRP